MKQVRQIHYRYLTDADFFNLNKPSGTEDKGGGQTYVDFPVKKIPLRIWESFFHGALDLSIEDVAQGKSWELPVHSIGLHLLTDVQRVKIYQRRSASISVAAQSLNRRASNRIRAWKPTYGFPQPANPTRRNGQLPVGLCVYFVRTVEREVWAGWFQQGAKKLAADETTLKLIDPMTSPINTAGSTGFIEIPNGVSLVLSEDNLSTPFASIDAGEIPALPVVISGEAEAERAKAESEYNKRDEQKILDSLFGEDQSETKEQETVERIQKVKIRNMKAVKDLKALYENRCQISGEIYSFKKIDGVTYSEVHHLIPLGKGGADDPRNMIVVNPLIHRMLHYAEVTGLDFNAIQEDEDGESCLEIRINGEPFTIIWHKDHIKKF